MSLKQSWCKYNDSKPYMVIAIADEVNHTLRPINEGWLYDHKMPDSSLDCYQSSSTHCELWKSLHSMDSRDVWLRHRYLHVESHVQWSPNVVLRHARSSPGADATNAALSEVWQRGWALRKPVDWDSSRFNEGQRRQLLIDAIKLYCLSTSTKYSQALVALSHYAACATSVVGL